MPRSIPLTNWSPSLPQSQRELHSFSLRSSINAQFKVQSKKRTSSNNRWATHSKRWAAYLFFVLTFRSSSVATRPNEQVRWPSLLHRFVFRFFFVPLRLRLLDRLHLATPSSVTTRPNEHVRWLSLLPWFGFPQIYLGNRSVCTIFATKI